MRTKPVHVCNLDVLFVLFVLLRKAMRSSTDSFSSFSLPSSLSCLFSNPSGLRNLVFSCLAFARTVTRRTKDPRRRKRAAVKPEGGSCTNSRP